MESQKDREGYLVMDGSKLEGVSKHYFKIYCDYKMNLRGPLNEENYTYAVILFRV